MRAAFFILAGLLCGCTISVVDKRVTREEIAAAFQQRDAAIEALIYAVQKISPPKGDEGEK